MKAGAECTREDKDSLFSFIERANSPSPRSLAKKTVWCVCIAFVAVTCALSEWTDALAGESCSFSVIVAVLALLTALTSKWVYFKKTEEISYGICHMSCGEWWYMEMWFNDRKNQLLIFNRVMRSPAFILVVGFYYKIKIGDDVAAEKLLDLARGLDPDLETIEMTSRRGLLRRDVEVLMEKIRRDLEVTWIYKLKQKKWLWATGGLLLFLLFVIRYIMVLVDSSRLLIKGLAE